MNSRISFLIVLLFLFSCDKEEVAPSFIYSPQISFEISEHLLQGTAVKQIEFTDNGYFYCTGKAIFCEEDNWKTSSFKTGSGVTSLAYNAREKSLYFGTAESGLGKYDGIKTTYFTVENSGLPRNFISHVECDDYGNVWFGASVHKMGSLVKYNGRSFARFLPENSSLPDNLIHKVKCYNGKIYVVSDNSDKSGTITSEIEGSVWTQLFESGGCSMRDLDIDSKGIIYYINDSREYCGGGLLSDEVVFSFENNQKTILREHEVSEDLPFLLETDKRNYVWVGKFPSDRHKTISVYDGKKWHEAPEEFPDDFIYCIEVDNKNNIWLGTGNGIYVLNQ